MTTDDYETESQLFKIAATYIKEDTNGPFYARIKQNLYNATLGRDNIIDSLQGHTTNPIEILTGKQPLFIQNASPALVANVGLGVVDVAVLLD